MMRAALGKPTPLPYVDEEDLLGMAADLGHGVFSSAELYDWYVGVCGRSSFNREPVTKKRFGMALKAAGWIGSAEYRDGATTRCWLINKPWQRRGEAYRLGIEAAAFEAASAARTTVSGDA